MSVCITKIIVDVKDSSALQNESKDMRSPASNFIKRKIDAKTGIPLNKFHLEKLGEKTAEDLLKLIEAFKWFDEYYDK
jgi:hypothetical protein